MRNNIEELLARRIEECEREERIQTKIIENNAEKRFKYNDARDRYDQAIKSLLYAVAQKDAYEDILGCIKDGVYQ